MGTRLDGTRAPGLTADLIVVPSAAALLHRHGRGCIRYDGTAGPGDSESKGSLPGSGSGTHRKRGRPPNQPWTPDWKRGVPPGTPRIVKAPVSVNPTPAVEADPAVMALAAGDMQTVNVSINTGAGEIHCPAAFNPNTRPIQLFVPLPFVPVADCVPVWATFLYSSREAASCPEMLVNPEPGV